MMMSDPVLDLGVNVKFLVLSSLQTLGASGAVTVITGLALGLMVMDPKLDPGQSFVVVAVSLTSLGAVHTSPGLWHTTVIWLSLLTMSAGRQGAHSRAGKSEEAWWQHQICHPLGDSCSTCCKFQVSRAAFHHCVLSCSTSCRAALASHNCYITDSHHATPNVQLASILASIRVDAAGT